MWAVAAGAQSTGEQVAVLAAPLQGLFAAVEALVDGAGRAAAGWAGGRAGEQ